MDPFHLEPAHDLNLPLKERLKSPRRESGLIGLFLHLIWWRLVRIYLRLYHRLHVTGLQHLPAHGPFVLVSNHQSHLDALVLCSQLPWRLRLHTHPIAAADTFFDNPASSAFAAATLNALPVQRGRAAAHALDDLRKRLTEEKCVYVLFPEGTRSRTGNLQPFKPGIGMFLATTNIPALPCHIQGAFESLPATKTFPRPHKLHLKIAPPLTFADHPNTREGWTQIAKQLEDAVRGLMTNDETRMTNQ